MNKTRPRPATMRLFKTRVKKNIKPMRQKNKDEDGRQFSVRSTTHKMTVDRHF